MISRVVRLSITPVKGTALHHPDSVRLAKSGAEGDRDFYLATAEGRLISMFRTGAFAHIRVVHHVAEQELALLDGDRELCRGAVMAGEPVAVDFYGERIVAGYHVTGPWDELFSDLTGLPVRLVRATGPNGGVDGAPATLIGAASVAAVAEQLGQPVDARRFRMLVELETAEPYVEDSWTGTTLAGDEVRLLVGGPVPRCAAVTRDPDSGARDLDVLHAIRRRRGVAELEHGRGICLGVYADVITGGTLRRGEQLRHVAPA